MYLYHQYLMISLLQSRLTPPALGVLFWGFASGFCLQRWHLAFSLHIFPCFTRWMFQLLVMLSVRPELLHSQFFCLLRLLAVVCCVSWPTLVLLLDVSVDQKEKRFCVLAVKPGLVVHWRTWVHASEYALDTAFASVQSSCRLYYNRKV